MKRLNLQDDYDKVKFFTILQMVFVTIAFISEAFFTQSVLNFSFIFQFIILLVTFNFYYRALSQLFYSFWNISFVLLVYYLVSSSRNFLVLDYPMIGTFYLLSIMFLVLACYVISSPLYYPRFHWWEYDFRFRADIRCLVEISGQQYRGRLSDLRRGAACMELFAHAQVGEMALVSVDLMNQTFSLYCEIKSRREPIIGRTVIYGVKFINKDLEHKQRLKLLTHYWNESKKIKIRNKFARQMKS
jgi:signal transduction histidine kinase